MNKSYKHTNHQPSHTYHEEHEHHYRKECKNCPHDEEREQDTTLETLTKLIEKDAERIGLIIANVFETLTLARVSLPDMELDTELMHLCVSDENISVNIVHSDDDEDDDVGDACEEDEIDE